jgi:hypothetical protein
MNDFEAVSALNRLLNILCRSLSAYLADAKPWARSDHRPLEAAFHRLLSDQQLYAQRLVEEISKRGGRPDSGGFPAEFSAKNDLSLNFLLQNVIECQLQDLVSIEHCASDLENEPALHALAEEILGNVKGHLDILKEQLKNQ